MNKYLNKKGQSLIMFVIFVPVLIMAFALIVDVGMMHNAKIKGENLLKEAIKENLDIKEYFTINDLEVTELKEETKNGKTCAIINTRIESIFGNLIGFKNYDIKINNC